MKLSILSIVLGLVVGIPSAWAVASPALFGAKVRKFPRSMVWGYLLMTAATAWFLYNLSLESVADFASYKDYMYYGFVALGILTCIFVSDFLAVRGLAVVLLLVAKTMLDVSHLHYSSWRLVIVVWAYILTIAGMWFTVSPWRLRDLIQWATATESKTRMLAGLRLAFALFIIVLGVAVF